MTTSLVLRESNRSKIKPYSLAIRIHDLSGTTYDILCYLDYHQAHLLTEAGEAYWLYGNPLLKKINKNNLHNEDN